MNTTQITGLVLSALATGLNLFLSESIKELVKRFFNTQSDKQVKKIYRVILIAIIFLPLLLLFKTSPDKSQPLPSAPVERIKPDK